jgi:uncharacterized protein YaiI (UPF0178 family)
LYRASLRTATPLLLVANAPLWVPDAEMVQLTLVPPGLDVADGYIVERVEAEDLVITADIPLAAAVIEKGACALTPRGKFYDRGNIGEAHAIRNFLDELRSGGVQTSGPPTFTPRDREAFANQLDRYLSRQKRV